MPARSAPRIRARLESGSFGSALKLTKRSRLPVTLWEVGMSGAPQCTLKNTWSRNVAKEPSMYKVPYFDLTAQYSQIRDEIRAALDRVSEQAAFILGEEVERFEHSFADYCGTKHAIALNSGTSALHLALLSAGIGAGDEVITTANTFIATAEAIAYTGARPVFADIDPATANIHPEDIEKAITPQTRAIIPVHLYGRPADLDAITDIATRHRLLVIEDACQAHGARYRRNRVGGFGHAAAFSFYPGKNLGAYGEGGVLTTNDDEVAKLVRSLRSHGETA